MHSEWYVSFHLIVDELFEAWVRNSRSEPYRRGGMTRSDEFEFECRQSIYHSSILLSPFA